MEVAVGPSKEASRSTGGGRLSGLDAFEVSFRLKSRPSSVDSRMGDPVEPDRIKDEVISWLEDLGFIVEDVQVEDNSGSDFSEYEVQVWHKREQLSFGTLNPHAPAYHQSVSLGTPDEVYKLDTGEEAQLKYDSIEGHAHKQLMHYPDYCTEEDGGDGDVIDEDGVF